MQEANRALQEVVSNLAPERRDGQPVRLIMKRPEVITCIKLSEGRNLSNIKLNELREKLQGNISRLLLVDDARIVRYIIHRSRIDSYLANHEGGLEHSLDTFIQANKQTEQSGYGLNERFIVVSEDTPVFTAKQRMEAVKGCQDIVVTISGVSEEPMSGWISNTRLTRFLTAE